MSGHTSRALLGALALCASAIGCEVPLTDGVYACADDDGCPAGWVCGADQRCYQTCTGGCLADAGSDAGDDAGSDAGDDAGSDAGDDAGSDAGGDAGPVIERNCACPGQPARECGSFTWVLELEAPGDELFRSWVNAVEIDDDGFVLFAGGTEQNATLAGTTEPRGDTSFGAGGFVARISPDGHDVCWNFHLPAPQTNVSSRVLGLARHDGVVYFLGHLEDSGVAPPFDTAAGPVSLTAPTGVVGAIDVATGGVDWARGLRLEDSTPTEETLVDIAANAAAVYVVGNFNRPTTLVDHDGVDITRTPDGQDAAGVRLRASDGGIDWFQTFGNNQRESAEAVAASGDRLAIAGERFQNRPYVRVFQGPTEVNWGDSSQRTISSQEGTGLDVVFVGEQLVVLGQAVDYIGFRPDECVDFEAGTSDKRVFVVTLDATDATNLRLLPDGSGSALRMTQQNDVPLATCLAVGPTRDGATVLLGGHLTTNDVAAVPQTGMGQLWFASASVSPTEVERPRWIATYPNTNPARIEAIAADEERVVAAGSFTNTFHLEPGQEVTRAAGRQGGLLLSSAGDRPVLASDIAAADGWRHSTPVSCPD